MIEIPFILSGFGNVGKAFARLVEEKQKNLQNDYGIRLTCKAITSSTGGVFLKDETPLKQIADYVDSGNKLHTFPEFGDAHLTSLKAIEKGKSVLLIETTPTNFETGEPGLSIVNKAFDSNMHVVIANKGPLVLAFRELHDRAQEKGRKLKISGATSAALPTVDVGEYALAGSAITKIEGIFTGTTNIILTRMAEENESYEEALAVTQKLGIAERNPSLDVDGWDTTAKTLLIANRVLKGNLKLGDMQRKGISNIKREDILSAAKKGKKYKLVGAAEKIGRKINAYVKPIEVDSTHPFFHVNGGDKAIIFYADSFGKVMVTGGKASPVGTAAAMLKDLINIYT